MKKVGVPETPLRSAESVSSEIWASPAWLRRSRANWSVLRPRSVACRIRSFAVSSPWWSSSRSCIGQIDAVEGQRRDQRGRDEAEAGDCADAGDGCPADRRPDPAPADFGEEPCHADGADRLAEDVAEQDPERDR